MFITRLLMGIIGGLMCTHAGAGQYDINGMQLDIIGYVGWKQINSTANFSNTISIPEMGITTSLKITNNLTFFNQHNYGTSYSSTMTYSQLNYRIPIPVNDLVVTTKTGRLLHDSALYSMTGINPMTRQGVFQPQSIYWDHTGQIITSGTGIGADIQYDKLLITAMVDKPKATTHISNLHTLSGIPKIETTTPFIHSSVTTQYELSDYKIRTLVGWERFLYPNGTPLLRTVTNNNYPATSGVDVIHQGIEWNPNHYHMSVETQFAKQIGNDWTDLHSIAIGSSSTVEHDITDNISLRANYNKFIARTDLLYQHCTTFEDINVGINWHDGHWMANIEGHYTRGDIQVTPNENSQHDTHYLITGANVVYFWD